MEIVNAWTKLFRLPLWLLVQTTYSDFPNQTRLSRQTEWSWIKLDKQDAVNAALKTVQFSNQQIVIVQL